MTSMPRSSFVSALAWLTLALGALGVFSALLQGVFATAMQPLLQTGYEGTIAALLPSLTLVSLAFALFNVWVGLRLLQRRDWARRAMLVLLAIGLLGAAVGALVCLGALSIIDGSLLTQAGLPDELFPLFRGMLGVIGAGALVIVGVHGWLISRLRSAAIKAEFSS